MNRFRVFSFIFVLFGAFFVSTTPAQADSNCTLGIWCGFVSHYSPDDGYDASFLVACDWVGAGAGSPSNVKYVAEGIDSRSLCPDVDGIYVNAGTKIRCLDMGGWITRWDATGWHRINNIGGAVCVYQLD